MQFDILGKWNDLDTQIPGLFIYLCMLCFNVVTMQPYAEKTNTYTPNPSSRKSIKQRCSYLLQNKV